MVRCVNAKATVADKSAKEADLSGKVLENVLNSANGHVRPYWKVLS